MINTGCHDDLLWQFFIAFIYCYEEAMEEVQFVKRVRNILHLEEYSDLRHTPGNFTIAVLDTGIVKHPDLKENIVGFYEVATGRTIPYDDNGHGTHIAGIICGNGAVSGGKYEGIMPSAKIVSIKILDRTGDGTTEYLLDALKWILKNHKHFRIRIVNISIGMEKSVSESIQKKIQELISQLYQENILIITAAGNNGPAPMTLSVLGESDDVIAVGCYDFGFRGKDGRSCFEYSARGPSRYSLKKPDLLAPGTEIISCSNQYRKGKGMAYTAKSGTSMATAVVTGAAAMLLTKHEYSSEELKNHLRLAAKDLHEPWNLQGFGVLDIAGILSKP